MGNGHLELPLLGVLARGPAHGCAVIAALREHSGGTFELPEGTVYPALHRLERSGLLASRWDEPSPRRRRLYRLTAGRSPSAGGPAGGVRHVHPRSAGRTAVGRPVTGAGRERRERRDGRDRRDGSDPVEAYLDRLFDLLAGSGQGGPAGTCRGGGPPAAGGGRGAAGRRRPGAGGGPGEPEMIFLYAAERCDTRSHTLSEYVDWRFGVMPKT